MLHDAGRKKQHALRGGVWKNTQGKSKIFVLPTSSSSLVFEIKLRLGLSLPGRVAKSD